MLAGGSGVLLVTLHAQRVSKARGCMGVWRLQAGAGSVSLRGVDVRWGTCVLR